MKTFFEKNPIIAGFMVLVVVFVLLRLFSKKSSYSNYRGGENICGTGCKRKFKADVSGKEKWCKGTWKIKLKNGEPRAYCDCVPSGK